MGDRISRERSRTPLNRVEEKRPTWRFAKRPRPGKYPNSIHTEEVTDPSLIRVHILQAPRTLRPATAAAADRSEVSTVTMLMIRAAACADNTPCAAMLDATCSASMANRAGSGRSPLSLATVTVTSYRRAGASFMCCTVSAVSDISGPEQSGSTYPCTMGTHAAEPATGDLDPSPAVRVQSGCGDLGQSRVQLRQLQAPQRPGIRLLAALGFLKEPLRLTIMIWAIHGSPVVVRVLPHCQGCLRLRWITQFSRQRFISSASSALQRCPSIGAYRLSNPLTRDRAGSS